MIKEGRGKLLIAGLVILFFGIAILSANRAERTDQIAEELVETATLSRENEGKLILLAGTPGLKAPAGVTDEGAGLSVEGDILHYGRRPLMKVYISRKEQVPIEKDNYGNYTYETWEVLGTMWGSANIAHEDVFINGLLRSDDRDVDGNRYPTGTFENPPPVEMDEFRVRHDLYIGEFKVDYSDVSSYVDTETAGFTKTQLEPVRDKYEQETGIRFEILENDNGYAFLSTGNEVGDLRVEIDYAKVTGAKPVTLIGRQQGDRLVLEDDIVSEAEQVQAGIISRQEFLGAASKEDASSRWIGIGFIAAGAVLSALSLNFGKREKTEKGKAPVKRSAGSSARKP